jgi:histone H3/H4
VDKLKYEQDKIVLIVDEFTYLYYHILEKKISPRIMEFWKGLVESRVFSFVFAGQDAMPRFMDEFQNVFASMHPQELTYIDEKSARELIEEPIWNHSKNCSRFHPDAVNEIIKLTACSPFYIMILCSELVKYARQRRRVPIQVSDVSSLVQRMICNESSISRKDFDNLISCGESRLDLIDKDDSIKVLKDIAVKSRNMDYYDINAINVFNKDKVKEIVDDLLRRGVLERHADLQDKVKIKVGLFKRWLLNHE